MKKIIAFISIFLFISNVYAYENDYFKIEIPDGYNYSTKDNIYVWSKDNEYVSVAIEENKDNYSVKKFTEEDIEKQKDYIFNTYKEKLSNYNLEPNIQRIELIKEDKIYYLEYDIYFNSKKSIGHDLYIKSRLYSTDNYIYSITYNSDKVISEDNIKTLNSLELKDTYLVNINVYYYSGLIIIVLCLLIYFYERKKA